ncbi:MAG: hypothetical protein AABX01_01320 [Candidatus Micrarchaeota archaeon]
MEHLEKRRKLFNRLLYTLVAFLIVALLAIAAFYDGVLFGIHLKAAEWGFMIIEFILIGYVYTLVTEEEKLEDGNSPK